MNRILPKFKFFAFLLLFFSFYENAIAQQCTILGDKSSGSYTPCTAFSGCSTVYVGDGTTPTILSINSDFNISCLGAINFVVMNNAKVLFGNGATDKLTLGEGSSITVIPGGILSGGDQCNSSDRIVIGTDLISTCNGHAGTDLSFADLMSFGGTGKATSNSPVCVGNNIVLSVTPPPIGTYTYVWTGPNGFTSTLQNPTPFTATATPDVAGIYTVAIKSSNNKTINAYTTVVVNTGTLPNAPTVSLVQPTCSVATGTITIDTPVPDAVLKYSIDGLTYSNTSGIFNLVSPGTYNVTVKNSSGCISPALSTTINPQPVIPVAPTFTFDNFSLACNQTTATETWASIQNISNYEFDISDDSFNTYISQNQFVSPSATSFDISNLIPGETYYVRARTVGICGTSANSGTVTITVDSLPQTPSATATSQPTCVMSTGVITVTTPTGMNYSINGSDYSNDTGVFNNVAVGSYTVTAKNNDGCVSLASDPINIVTPANIWDGSKWSKSGNTTPPTIGDAIVFEGNFISAGNINGCSCTVNSGTVTMQSGGVMNITNAVTNIGGTLIFENNASLIQTNPATNINSGPIIYRRDSQPMKALDYTYWSSPVEGQKLGTAVPGSPTNKLYSWGTTNWVNESATNLMAIGKGYIIRTLTAGTKTAQFEGIPNNGDYTFTTNIAGLQNVIGNPYPSAVSADAFIQENTFDHPRLNGTIYFWTHNTAYSGGKYVSTDYAAYNFTGGVGTTGSGTAVQGTNNTVPSGFIAAGQSFLVLSKGTQAGTAVFKNSMRVSSEGDALDNSNFFRGTKSKTAAAEKHRVWLNLTNSEGAFKQMLVGYLAGATAGYDEAFDGPSVNGNSFVNFYSISEKKNYTIQGRGLPFDSNEQVPLGYSTTINGTFQISIDNTDGSLSNQPIYVEDKLTNVIHNLKNGPYSFSTAIGTFNDRFVMRYSDKTAVDTTLDNPVFDEKRKGLVVSSKNHKIKINSFDELIENVMVYDLKGSLLYEKSKVNTNEFVPDFNSSNQFLIVMVQLSNGKWVTKEIVF